MNKVFIVVEPIPYEGDTVLRVFANYEAALGYGEQLVEDGTIEEFDVYEREVYQNPCLNSKQKHIMRQSKWLPKC